MERSVGEVLLPGLDEVRRRNGPASTKWAVAYRWAIDWLSRAQRLAPCDPRRCRRATWRQTAAIRAVCG